MAAVVLREQASRFERNHNKEESVIWASMAESAHKVAVRYSRREVLRIKPPKR